jgi:hypothetical protein
MSLGRRRCMGDTGRVCSSDSSNLSKISGEVLGVLMTKGLGVGGGGGARLSMGDSVGACFALRACSALRRYSDLGATDTEAVRGVGDRV